MTTVIAIDSRDGLIMAADLQATTGLAIEYVNKIRNIRPNELLGCAGTAEYIDIFYRHVVDSLSQEERPKDYLQSLNNAVDTYCEYIDNRIDKLGLESVEGFRRSDCYPDGMLAVDDGGTRKRIFTIHTPDPCFEVPDFQHRACVGSGGVSATIILRTLENLMLSWRVDNQSLTWTHFSWKTIGELCWILQERISEIDPYSRGHALFKLDDRNSKGVNYQDLFSSLDRNKQFSELLLNVVKEITPATLMRNLEGLNYDLIFKELGLA